MGGAPAGTHFLTKNLRKARKSGGERRLRRAGNSRYAYRTCTRYIVYAYTRPILGSTRFRETPPTTLKKSLINEKRLFAYITGCNQACRSSNLTWNQDGMIYEVMTVHIRTELLKKLMIRRLDFDAYSNIIFCFQCIRN